MNSVRAKLNDPNLQKEVKEKAAAGLVLALQHCQLAVVGGQGDGVLAGGGAGRGRCDEACESVDASVGESVDASVDAVSEPTDNAGDTERRGEAGDGEGADAGGGEK